MTPSKVSTPVWVSVTSESPLLRGCVVPAIIFAGALTITPILSFCSEDGRAQYEIIDGKPKETAGLATSGEFNEARKEAPPAGTKIGGNAGFAAAGGAAAAGVTGAALASRDTSTTSGSGSGGPGSKIGEVAHSADPEALKQELKRNQEAGGYDSSNAHHVETEGPHGLVWDGEKYVHRREIDHKGSTGVPLQ